mmetsp:Transcript_31217/g.78144  ORF Transcript_31217/g.78144 Transcript_31217/m.78144 type:complete len:254 (+) Transcript_31217:424-1185(+)
MPRNRLSHSSVTTSSTSTTRVDSKSSTAAPSISDTIPENASKYASLHDESASVTLSAMAVAASPSAAGSFSSWSVAAVSAGAAPSSPLSTTTDDGGLGSLCAAIASAAAASTPSRALVNASPMALANIADRDAGSAAAVIATARRCRQFSSTSAGVGIGVGVSSDPSVVASSGAVQSGFPAIAFANASTSTSAAATEPFQASGLVRGSPSLSDASLIVPLLPGAPLGGGARILTAIATTSSYAPRTAEYASSE